MIELYGKTYARNGKELIETLFEPIINAEGVASTAHGLYKRTARGVFLYTPAGEMRAFIRRDGLGPVTATRKGRRVRYMYALSTLDGQWLGVPDSYVEQRDQAHKLMENIERQRTNRRQPYATN